MCLSRLSLKVVNKLIPTEGQPGNIELGYLG